MFNELSVTVELRELWLSIYSPAKTSLIVSSDAIRQKLLTFVAPIVEIRYPDLVEKGRILFFGFQKFIFCFYLKFSCGFNYEFHL